MSFDIFLQAFENGDAAPGDVDATRAALMPYVRDLDTGARIETADGEAALSTDLFEPDAVDCSMMINHAGGSVVWDVIYDVAKAGGLVIMPVGCPVCVVDEAQIAHLPRELVEACGVVVAVSGADVLASVRAS